MIHIGRFVIIQSLVGERRTGDEVFQQMKLGTLKPESKGEFVPALELYDVHSRTEFFGLLGDIMQLTIAGTKPLLHFEMHGRKEGLVLSDDSLITWNELKEPIRAINILSGNNLFVGLATCFGAHFLKLNTVWEPCPFYGYIGAQTEVLPTEFEVSFSEFYRILIETRSFFDAINALHESLEDNEKIYNYTNCEGFFDLMVNEHWHNRNGGLGAKIKFIKQLANQQYIKEKYQKVGVSKRQYTKMLDRLVTSGKIEADLLKEMRDVFLHKRQDGRIYSKFVNSARENLNKFSTN